MKRLTGLAIILVVVLVGWMLAQDSSEPKAAPALWNVHVTATPPAEGRWVKAIFTPKSEITVTRIEAFSERGPVAIAAIGRVPAECPLTYSLEISNGVTSRTIPLSRVFMKGSASIYTDSGTLDITFSAGTPVTLALINPPAGFPPAACGGSGYNVAVQFEAKK